MARQQKLLESAMRKFLHAKMYAACNHWCSWAAEMRRQQGVLRGALNRMKLRQVSMGWNTWRASVCSVQGQADLMRRCVVCLMKRKAVMSWNTWREAAAQMKREQDLLRHAGLRLVRRHLGMAWSSWQACVEGSTQDSAWKRLVVDTSHHVAKTFKKWKIWRKYKENNSMACVHWIFGLVLLAWNSWRDAAWIMSKADKIRIAYQECLLNRMDHGNHYRMLQHSVRRWQMWAVQKKLQHKFQECSSLDRAQAHWRSFKISAYLDIWRSVSACDAF